MDNLTGYKKIVGAEKIKEIHKHASKLKGKHLLNINTTYQGGGVAEILNSLIPLMNKLGIDAGWRILHGPPDFFMITKKFFNALHGEKINFTRRKQKLYIENCERFSSFTHIHHDAVIIHDIQPLPLIKFYKKNQPWIWRCHADISSHVPEVFNYLNRNFIHNYDHMVVLSKKFLQQHITPKQAVMPPSIDPLSAKNKELTDKISSHYLNKFGILTDKPILCQVSRFDKWKDPMGVVEIFKKVKRRVDCRLVLIGAPALDDPTSQKIYGRTIKKVSGDKDIILINLENNILVNVLQRKSAVIIQKSLREGFGLTVTEALWKQTPVVASDVGGISDQIISGKNGYLLKSDDTKGFADSVVKILRDKKLRDEMGEFGKQHVKENFLITSHLLNWLLLLEKVFKIK